MHTALDLVDELWILKRYPNGPIAAISRSQVARPLQEGRENIRVIYHGCDFDQFEPSFAGGEISRVHQPHGSAKEPAWGLPIVLAGRPQTHAEEVYFNEQVKPPFDGRNVIYRGEVIRPVSKQLASSHNCSSLPATHNII
jgi:hypothetical protein